MTRVSDNNSVVLKALSHKNRSAGNGAAGGSSGSSGSKRATAHKHYPVGRRGVFKVQVADADELRLVLSTRVEAYLGLGLRSLEIPGRSLGFFIVSVPHTSPPALNAAARRSD